MNLQVSTDHPLKARDLPYLLKLDSKEKVIRSQVGENNKRCLITTVALLILAAVSLFVGTYLIVAYGTKHLGDLTAGILMITLSLAFIGLAVKMTLKTIYFLKEKSDQLYQLEESKVPLEFVLTTIEKQFKDALSSADKKNALKEAHDRVKVSLNAIYTRQKTEEGNQVLDNFLNVIIKKFSGKRTLTESEAEIFRALAGSVWIFEIVNKDRLFGWFANEILNAPLEIAFDLSTETIRQGYSKLISALPSQLRLVLKNHPELVACFSTNNTDNNRLIALPSKDIKEIFRSMGDAQRILFLRTLKLKERTQLETIHSTIKKCFMFWIGNMILTNKYPEESIKVLSEWYDILAPDITSFWERKELMAAFDRYMKPSQSMIFARLAASVLISDTNYAATNCISLLAKYKEGDLPKILKETLAHIPEILAEAARDKFASDPNVKDIYSMYMIDAERLRYDIVMSGKIKERFLEEINKLCDVSNRKKKVSRITQIESLISGTFFTPALFVECVLDNKSLQENSKYSLALDMLESLNMCQRAHEFLTQLDPKRPNNIHFVALFSRLVAQAGESDLSYSKKFLMYAFNEQRKQLENKKLAMGLGPLKQLDLTALLKIVEEVSSKLKK